MDWKMKKSRERKGGKEKVEKHRIKRGVDF